MRMNLGCGKGNGNGNGLHSECGGCGGEKRWVVHNVRHRAAYRRLCTNCILKSHEGLFCPLCFHVYEDSLPPPSDRLVCLKCPSISHLSCLPSSLSPPSFLCPSCSSSSSPHLYFNLNPIDKDSARALVAAAKIAALSMAKAAALARLEAERRVKEATFAKKRAREALETLALLSSSPPPPHKSTIPPPTATSNTTNIPKHRAH